MARRAAFWRRLLRLLVFLAVLPLAFLWASREVGGRADREALALAEQAVRRAAVQCYALEGFYPADLDYLKAHYGVTADGAYWVDYRYVASNLMPDITVLPVS